MNDFINTIDILGDDAVIDSIIDRSIAEFADDRLTAVGVSAFKGCAALKFADLPIVNTLGSGVFSECGDLVALILRSETMCTLGGTFSSDPFTAGTGYIYIPSALLDTYKAATNWSTYADQFRAIEDYTVDGTVMGAFLRCSGITLDQTALTFDEWASQTLTATTSTPSPIGLDVVVWKSADESIAQVNNGVVSPIGKGSTVITASCNGYSATCEVVVNLDGINVLIGVAFNAGFINNNGSITAGGANDVYTDKFGIAVLAGSTIVVNLLDVKSTATYSRIMYYSDNGAVVGYTEGSAGTNGVVITSTVPNNATLAALSINKSNGFSGIEITIDGMVVGLLNYTT